jgi:hypothetical protein
MDIRYCAPLLALMLVSCAAPTRNVETEVRAFAAGVARDVTEQGPVAWNRHFSDNPAFFMVSNGQLVFPDRATATSAIQELRRALPHIHLEWGPDLRVDPLSADFAVVAASYHELQTRESGEQVNESGFFTATAERRSGRWQFRNAHWSVPVPSR